MTYPIRITDTTRNIYLRSLNSLILTNAPILGYKTVDVAIEIVDPTNQDQAKSGMLQADLLHFTELGHQTVYDKLNSALGLSSTVIVSTGTTSTGTTSTGTLAVVSTTDKATEIIVSGNTISSTTNAWKSVR